MWGWANAAVFRSSPAPTTCTPSASTTAAAYSLCLLPLMPPCCTLPTSHCCAVTHGHYLFAWRGEAAEAAAEAALGSPDAWPYVLPGQLEAGDIVPVVVAAWDGSRRVELARVAGVEAVQDMGVFMPHTLTGALCFAV